MEQLKNGMNLTMLFDYYEMTMMNGYFENGLEKRIGYFDMFFRRVPDDGGFAIMAGLEQVIDYIENLVFLPEDIAYLREKKIFSEDFLRYLENFKFSCDVWAMPEGSVIFPNEPILVVRGPVMEAQLLETMILLTINHQSLIATKANRIVRAAMGRPVAEFGARRAHSYSAAIYGARAAYIGGVSSTSCALTDQQFGVPASGTMAHSWVQMFPTEYEAFEAYARVYPESCVLLIDTYDVLGSGLPNAIRCFKDVILPTGNRPAGIRIDSGDVAYLTKKARAMLDEAGFPDCKIIISNSLDEFLIHDILNQGAEIDAFGVGERLITSRSEPVFGGVYKLVAVEDEDGTIQPRIKLSENVTKITNPGFKKVWRLYGEDGEAFADVLTLADEVIDPAKGPYTIFHPEYTWKSKKIENFTVREMLVPIYEKGKLVYERPTVQEIRKYAEKELSLLWNEVKRLKNPHVFYVDLSQKLWEMKEGLLKEKGRR
ncbi:MAG: nicotinate phosphoribosyltransferase [Clostridia bacterium]|nr:nicotinate phosphoribosyltransferase [Clostridia bacterium]